jgi:simple sugar transport system substrate-binding protein
MKRVKTFMKVMATAALMATTATVAMAETKGAKIFVIGGKADDPFWSKIKKGADDAGLVAKATGGSDCAGPASRCHRRPRLGPRGHG